MGVIKSQSIYSTIISYVGVVFGFITSALIMPKILTTDQLGLTKLIVAVTGVFSSIFSLGISQLLYRAYPLFSDDSQKLAKLFYFSIKIAIWGTFLALPFYFFSAKNVFNFCEPITDFEKTSFFLIGVFIVILFRILYISLYGFVRMTGQIVVDTIIQNIFLKGGMMVFLLLFYLNWINFTSFVYLEMALYLCFPLLIIGYLVQRKSLPKLPAKTKFSKPEKKELLNLSLYGTLTTIGSSLYLYLDTLMVNHYLGESDVGVYGTLFLFGIIVIVPARSLKAAAVSILSKAYKEEDYTEIASIYRKSSDVLLVVGGFIFLGVFTNLYSVFAYLPKEFEIGAAIVFWIGIAQLVDMVCGVNHEIISSSPKYRLNTWFIGLSALSAVGLNMLFIPMYGVEGAAIATFSSVFMVNVLRLIAVWRIFRIQPISLTTFKIILLIILSFLIVESVPNVENFILNLFLKGTLLSIIYLPTVYYFKLSSDLRELIDNLLKRFVR